MCGIFGCSILNQKKESIKTISRVLYELSETRGKEASGIAVLTDQVNVFKTDLAAKQFIRRKEYHELINKISSLNNASFLGHTRLVTDGDSNDNKNNQPVAKGDLAGVHNGIIVNYKELWSQHFPNVVHSELDSEIFFQLFQDKLYNQQEDLVKSLRFVFQEIYGMTTIATYLSPSNQLLLCTNNGSLYYLYSSQEKIFLFASEFAIIKEVEKSLNLQGKCEITHIKANNALLLDLDTHEKLEWDILTSEKEIKINKSQEVFINEIPFNDAKRKTLFGVNKTVVSTEIETHFKEAFDRIKKISRCKKCLLPHTMPSVSFNHEGICSNCTNYKHRKLLGENQLKEKVDELGLKNGENKVLVGLSGGRDSCITLDYVVHELGLKPIAFSYDWGVITDLARRNQSRMCGKLGIEHILVSADIKKKRNNIHKNVSAWLKRPHLGIIPLFMAGDKQYFHHANRIRKLYNIPVTIMGENHYEKTQFKTGFLGVKQDEGGAMAYNVNLMNKVKMVSGYAKEFALNPAYINSSILDTASAFKSYYVNDHSFYINLFDYIDWNEDKVNDTLINNYDWELATDTKSTWRIGDGTAAFYNYIYLMVAGFTEFDTFNSNLIRAGIISRDDALAKTFEENQPRYDTIKWYLDAINLDMEQTLKIINKIPKLY